MVKPKPQSNRFKRYLRPFLWRWHRRLGVIAALILVVVTVTGILLNHTSQLQLSKRSVQSHWLLHYYNLPIPKLTTWAVGGAWLSGDNNEYIYLDDRQIAYCNGGLVGAVNLGSNLLAACRQELLLLTTDGEIIERLGASYGVPVPIEAIGYCDIKACLKVADKVIAVDVDQLRWDERSGDIDWTLQETLPEPIHQRLIAGQIGSGLSWEKVVQDLHSGRIAGNVGVWVVDIAALILLFLAISGFVLWYQQTRRRKQ